MSFLQKGINLCCNEIRAASNGLTSIIYVTFPKSIKILIIIMYARTVNHFPAVSDLIFHNEEYYFHNEKNTSISFKSR